jgi:hypothetical protein
MKAPKAHPVRVSRFPFAAGLPRRARAIRRAGFVLGLAGLGACYSAGNGSPPPNNGLYYPVGLAVSNPAHPANPANPNPANREHPGDFLFVANSDFDLQFNGGTLQSNDLRKIRNDTAALIAWNLRGGKQPPTGIPFVFGPPPLGQCMATDLQAPLMRDNGQRTPLGQTCAPPVDSTSYIKHHVVIGAFATDLQLGPDGSRLLMPVRGNATLTYADLKGDGSDIKCDPGSSDRCGGPYVVGNTVDARRDTRGVTMPGEPFGMAQTQDGTAIAVTQQATPETSLLLSGYDLPSTAGGVSNAASVPQATLGTPPEPPSMQFVLEGVPVGGNGIVAVPHDRDAVTRCEDVGDSYPCVRQAFLETSRYSAIVSLLRYYDDQGSAVHNDTAKPSLKRPFLEQEAQFGVTVNLPGTDQRGIVIDDTPRLKCKAQAALTTGAVPGGTDASGANPFRDCGQLPARVFIGSRSPPSVIFGEIGGLSLASDGTVDPDQLRILASVPVGDEQGVSRLYLAPIVDAKGHYALKLFVVLFDASTVWVFDPETIDGSRQEASPEAVLTTGPGPFAMAFDPFCTGLVDKTGNPLPTPLDPATPPDPTAPRNDCRRYGPFSDVAVSEVAEMLIEQNKLDPARAFLVPADPTSPSQSLGLRSYRFGYLATFTNSFLQVLDLDDALLPLPSATPSTLPLPTQETFESIVFTLGKPTPPLGS